MHNDLRTALAEQTSNMATEPAVEHIAEVLASDPEARLEAARLLYTQLPRVQKTVVEQRVPFLQRQQSNSRKSGETQFGKRRLRSMSGGELAHHTLRMADDLENTVVRTEFGVRTMSGLSAEDVVGAHKTEDELRTLEQDAREDALPRVRDAFTDRWRDAADEVLGDG